MSADGPDNKNKNATNATNATNAVTPPKPQMDLGETPPSPVLAAGPTEDKNQFSYDLIAKSTLQGEPPKKELWIEDKVMGNQLNYSVKDRDGKIVKETLDLTKAKIDMDNATKAKVTQDWLNINKKLILDSIRAQSQARLFKNVEELAKAKKLSDEAEVSKEVKKRLSLLNEYLQNPHPEAVTSNLEQAKHLMSMNMEGLAVKMAVDQIMWVVKTVFFVQYATDMQTYNALAKSKPELIYNIGKEDDSAKPLYYFELVGNKIRLDKNKPLNVVNGKLAGEKPTDPSGRPYSDSLVIMANGYLPTPSLLGSWKKELSTYVEKQTQSIIDPQQREIEAAFYKTKKRKSKEGESEEDATRERLIAQNLAARPKPTPSGGK